MPNLFPRKPDLTQHVFSDPACSQFNPDLNHPPETRGFRCQVCAAEQRKDQTQSFQDRGWYQKLAAAEKAQEEPQKPQDEDWDRFLGTLGGGSSSGPTELDAATRASHAHYFAHYQSLQAAGFTKVEAFALLHGQLQQIAGVQARWELEQKGGA